MNRNSTIVAATAAAAICSGTMVNADDDQHCQTVRQRSAVVDAQFPCSIDPSFSGCFVLSSKGIFGTWLAFVQDAWFVPLDPPDFPVPPQAVSNYNREFNVYSNEHGSVHGDSQYVFDLRIFDVGGGFVSPAIIDGGTGIYEGATGFISSTFVDADLTRAIVIGRVCGPNIPGDDDDDSDSDSDD